MMPYLTTMYIMALKARQPAMKAGYQRSFRTLRSMLSGIRTRKKFIATVSKASMPDSLPS